MTSDRTVQSIPPRHAADGRSPFAGRPLDGLVVLALEQMAALPFATQLMGRLGARIIKVEHPTHGESGRQSSPAMTDPEGRTVGATFLRSNLGKDSVGIDLKSEAGRQLVIELAAHADVIAENFKPGTLDRLGLGPKTLAEANPRAVLVSVSGFGSDPASPYRTRPAYASIVEGMSGVYEFKRHGDEPLHVNPVGALGDISAGLFAVIGVLAALRQREVTGEGQHVDVAMLDSVLAMTDVVTNFASMGQPNEPDPAPYVLSSFRTCDGSLVIQLVREHQFVKLAQLIGHPEWLDDPRFAERTGWGEHTIRREVFDVTRENMAQIVDTPKRRAFMKEARPTRAGSASPGRRSTAAGGRGCLRVPAQRGARRSRWPADRQGRRHHRQDADRARLRQVLKDEFLPRSSTPRSSSPSATPSPTPAPTPPPCAQGRAHHGGRRDGWMLNGQKTWTTSAHFADWYWVGARTDPDNQAHGITLFLVPMNHPGITINGIWTMGDERTNEVFFDDVFVPDEYVVGEVNKGFQYISQALDLERFTMFTYAPIKQRLDVLTDYVRRPSATASRSRTTRSCGPRWPTCTPRPRSPGCSGSSSSPRRSRSRRPTGPVQAEYQPPTVQASEYKLFATECPRRSPMRRWTSAGPAPSCG
jgi:crotonobetainyl-CoA:carnitine CoA-transferase CaiB-like acyl-CoA transferase